MARFIADWHGSVKTARVIDFKPEGRGALVEVGADPADGILLDGDMVYCVDRRLNVTVIRCGNCRRLKPDPVCKET